MTLPILELGTLPIAPPSLEPGFDEILSKFMGLWLEVGGSWYAFWVEVGALGRHLGSKLRF